MRRVRIGYRLLLIAVHVMVGLVISATLLRHGEGRPATKNDRAIIGWWMRRVTRILGLDIKVLGVWRQEPVLVVSNHISWLDIPVLACLCPVSFVSKIEIRAWPLLGFLAARAGTLFIQRGGKNAAPQAAEQIAFRLRAGDSVAIFPEGTTSDGQGVRRFHARLFGAAVQAETGVLPVALRYPHAQGVHPAAPFVDEETIFSHGVRVLGERRIDVEVTFCRRLLSHAIDRRTLSLQAFEAIKGVVEQQGVVFDARLDTRAR